MTTAGRGYTKPWRVTWYSRDPVTGKPVGGGRRAFALEDSAAACAAERMAEGWHVERWREDTLPGVGP